MLYKIVEQGGIQYNTQITEVEYSELRKIRKMLLMRKCCCFDLRTGCIVTALIRSLHWVIIFAASVYTCLHVFSPDDKGLFYYRATLNIQENGKQRRLLIFQEVVSRFMDALHTRFSQHHILSVLRRTF